MLAINFDDFARLAHTYMGEPTTTRKHRYFAGEHTRSKDGYGFFGFACRFDDFDLTGGDHEEPCRALTRFDQHFSMLDPSEVTMRGDPRDLGRGQSRKHLVGSRRLSRKDRWGCIHLVDENISFAFCLVPVKDSSVHLAETGSLRNLFAARIVSATKSAKTTNCATRNGGSDPVGAIAFRAGTF